MKPEVTLVGKFLIHIALYVGCAAGLLAAMDLTWPQLAHYSPLDWQWWLQILMVAALISAVEIQWKNFKADYKEKNASKYHTK